MMRPPIDTITIEDFFSFKALTSVTRPDDRSLIITIQFIVHDAQDLQILGGLFNEGQEVRLWSAFLEDRYGKIPPVLIKQISMPKDALFWECLIAYDT